MIFSRLILLSIVVDCDYILYDLCVFDTKICQKRNEEWSIVTPLIFLLANTDLAVQYLCRYVNIFQKHTNHEVLHVYNSLQFHHHHYLHILFLHHQASIRASHLLCIKRLNYKLIQQESIRLRSSASGYSFLLCGLLTNSLFSNCSMYILYLI